MRKEMADYDASVPLITRIRGEGDRTLISQSWTEAQAGFALWVRDVRARGRLTLTSRSVQFIILSLVALDGAVLLLKVFLQLIACEMHQNDLRWVVGTRKSLGAVGLTFSVFFLLEAIFSVVSFGFV